MSLYPESLLLGSSAVQEFQSNNTFLGALNTRLPSFVASEGSPLFVVLAAKPSALACREYGFGGFRISVVNSLARWRVSRQARHSASLYCSLSPTMPCGIHRGKGFLLTSCGLGLSSMSLLSSCCNISGRSLSSCSFSPSFEGEE